MSYEIDQFLIQPCTPEQRQAARLAVATRATDPHDARTLLDMLGLLDDDRGSAVTLLPGLLVILALVLVAALTVQSELSSAARACRASQGGHWHATARTCVWDHR